MKNLNFEPLYFSTFCANLNVQRCITIKLYLNKIFNIIKYFSITYFLYARRNGTKTHLYLT